MRFLLLVVLALAAGCSASRSVELTAMTFNVRYGTADDGPDAWPLRREIAFDVLRNHAPDIVGMQEVLAFQQEEFLAACPGHAAIGRGRETDGSGEASPILYRQERFRVVESGTFWLSEAPERPGSRGWDAALPRVCTWALLEESGGARLWVFNSHFDHVGAAARLESARLVASRIAARAPSHPAILLGDFNTGEGTAPILALGDLVSAFRARHPDATEVGTFHGFKGGSGGAMIDHVFVTPDVEVLAAEIVRDARDGRFPSDHYPVLARVRVSAPPTSSGPPSRGK